MNGKAYLQVSIDGEAHSCMLDTVSDTALIPFYLARGVELEETKQRLLAANGTPLRVLGRASIMVNVHGHEFMVGGLVSDNITEMMMVLD